MRESKTIRSFRCLICKQKLSRFGRFKHILKYHKLLWKADMDNWTKHFERVEKYDLIF
jgi:hypothetical protein